MQRCLGPFSSRYFLNILLQYILTCSNRKVQLCPRRDISAMRYRSYSVLGTAPQGTHQLCSHGIVPIPAFKHPSKSQTRLAGQYFNKLLFGFFKDGGVTAVWWPLFPVRISRLAILSPVLIEISNRSNLGNPPDPAPCKKEAWRAHIVLTCILNINGKAMRAGGQLDHCQPNPHFHNTVLAYQEMAGLLLAGWDFCWLTSPICSQ